jgi:uncharacterized protein
MPRTSRTSRTPLRPADALDDVRRIAVVGASDDPRRPSHGVMGSLLRRGYDVVPVNPNAERVHGLEAVDRLADVEGPIDLVDVFRRPEHAPDVAREAAAVGARVLWLQTGVVSDRAREIAEEAGMDYVEDACLGVVAMHVPAPR